MDTITINNSQITKPHFSVGLIIYEVIALIYTIWVLTLVEYFQYIITNTVLPLLILPAASYLLIYKRQLSTFEELDILLKEGSIISDEKIVSMFKIYSFEIIIFWVIFYFSNLLYGYKDPHWFIKWFMYGFLTFGYLFYRIFKLFSFDLNPLRIKISMDEEIQDKTVESPCAQKPEDNNTVLETKHLEAEQVKKLEEERKALEAKELEEERIKKLEEERKVLEAKKLEEERIKKLEEERKVLEAKKLEEERIKKLEEERKALEAKKLEEERKALKTKQYEREINILKELDDNSQSQNISIKLINCPACGKAVSNQAPNCPNCGQPIVVKQANRNVRIKMPNNVAEGIAQALSSRECRVTANGKLLWKGLQGQNAIFSVDRKTKIVIDLGGWANQVDGYVEPGKKYSLIQDMGIHWLATYRLTEVDIIDTD